MAYNSSSHNLPLALGLVLLATLNYAAMGIFAKLALTHTPTTIVLFIRFLILFICILPFIAKKGFKIIKTQHFGLHFIRGVAAVLAITFTFISIKFIPLATVVLLSSTEPLFVPLILRIARGIKIIPKMYWGIGVGLIGIAFILHPSNGFFRYAALMALAAGVLRGISVSTARSLTKTDLPQTIMFYFFFLGMVFTGFSTLGSWHDLIHWSWGWMIGVGLSSFIFQFCLTNALKHAPARIISPCCYFAVLFTALADWILWDQYLTPFVLLGMALVVLGAVLTVLFGRSIIQSSVAKEKN